MKKNQVIIFLLNFVVCGLLGWCFECFWTGLSSLFQKNRKLSCQTSLWMFFIYGMAAIIGPIYRFMARFPFWVRGGIYAIAIYLVEYLTGSVLKRFRACPWNYSKCKHNIKGLINMDYAGAWFVMGLIYEKILIFTSRFFESFL